MIVSQHQKRRAEVFSLNVLLHRHYSETSKLIIYPDTQHFTDRKQPLFKAASFRTLVWCKVCLTPLCNSTGVCIIHLLPAWKHKQVATHEITLVSFNGGQREIFTTTDGKLKSGKKQHLGDIHTPKEQRKLEIHDKKLH